MALSAWQEMFRIFFSFHRNYQSAKEKNEPKCTAFNTRSIQCWCVSPLSRFKPFNLFFSCWRNTFLPVKCNFSLQRIKCCYQKVTKTMTSKRRRRRPYFTSLPNPLLGCACLVMPFKWLEAYYILMRRHCLTIKEVSNFQGQFSSPHSFIIWVVTFDIQSIKISRLLLCLLTF